METYLWKINEDKLKKGITTVSAGSHAIAASYAANLFNIKNKIFLYKSANQFRIQTCKNLNANIIFTDPELAFHNVESAVDEGYTFVHPFDGSYTLQGTSTLGYEIFNQIKDMHNISDDIDSIKIFQLFSHSHQLTQRFDVEFYKYSKKLILLYLQILIKILI